MPAGRREKAGGSSGSAEHPMSGALRPDGHTNRARAMRAVTLVGRALLVAVQARVYPTAFKVHPDPLARAGRFGRLAPRMLAQPPNVQNVGGFFRHRLPDNRRRSRGATAHARPRRLPLCILKPVWHRRLAGVIPGFQGPLQARGSLLPHHRGPSFRSAGGAGGLQSQGEKPS